MRMPRSMHIPWRYAYKYLYRTGLDARPCRSHGPVYCLYYMHVYVRVASINRRGGARMRHFEASPESHDALEGPDLAPRVPADKPPYRGHTHAVVRSPQTPSSLLYTAHRATLALQGKFFCVVAENRTSAILLYPFRGVHLSDGWIGWRSHSLGKAYMARVQKFNDLPAVTVPLERSSHCLYTHCCRTTIQNSSNPFGTNFHIFGMHAG